MDGPVQARTATEVYWLNHPMGALDEMLQERPQGRRFFRAHGDVPVNLDPVRPIGPCGRSAFVPVMADAQATELAVSERQAKLLRER